MTTTVAEKAPSAIPNSRDLLAISMKVGEASVAIEKLIQGLRAVRDAEASEPLTAAQAWHLHNFALGLSMDVDEFRRWAEQVDDLAECGFCKWGWGDRF